jgi:type I restriction enzyme S subunit
MAWTAATLGEICDRVGGIIRTGPFGSQLHQSDYSDDGIPVVMPKDIIEGRIVTDEIACVAPEHIARLSRHKLKPGDIVYGRLGDIGRQALIRQQQAGWLCGTGCLRLSLGDSVIDPSFLHYYLREPGTIGWITNQAIGATMPNLNTSILRSVPIRFPLLPTQRKIAVILSSYDDLIENNLRRIKILEEMAQNLYREWFVKFRFPGHQNAGFVDSSLGRIPEGWEVVNLLDIAVVKYGKNLPTKNLNPNAAYPVYGAAKIIGKYAEYTREVRTIITGCRGSVGEMQITLPKCFVTNNSFTFDVQERIDFFWLFHCLKDRGFADVIGGAAQPQITLDGLSKIQVVVPLNADRALFHEHVEDIYSHLWNLESRNICLRRTRDLLLPKLISGEVDVSELDITIPEEVAA